MNKDDILQKSREENKKGDERVEKIKLRSYATSAAIGALICMVFIIWSRTYSIETPPISGSYTAA